MTNKLNIALTGAGTIGGRHIALINASPACAARIQQ
jgi:hypothetical protein